MSSLRFVYFSESVPDDVVRRSVSAVREAGFSTVEDPDCTDGSSLTYRIGGWESEWKTVEDTGTRGSDDVFEQIHDADQASIRFWTDEDVGSLRFRIETSASSPRVPVKVLGPHRRSYDGEEWPRETIEARIGRAVELFTRLAEVLDPWFALAHVYDEYLSELFPDDRPPESGIERLPWLSVFGSEWYDCFGGSDRLLEAPAWNVTALKTGGVLLREHELPWPQPTEIDRDPPLSTYEYLFEGKDLADLRAERTRKLNTIVDPFREIEPGERGTDLVVCKGHAPFDASDVDYHEVTSEISPNDNCYVLWVTRDEHDRLWEVDSEVFVRRLVDEDGIPIGDLPNDVPPERELLSAAVDTALEPWPTEFFEMESTEDASFVGRLFGLAGIPANADIWRDGNECHGGLDEQS